VVAVRKRTLGWETRHFSTCSKQQKRGERSRVREKRSRGAKKRKTKSQTDSNPTVTLKTAEKGGSPLVATRENQERRVQKSQREHK